MSRRSRIVAVLMTLALGLVIAAPGRAAEPIRIGYIGGLTGYLVDLDSSVRDGVLIGVDEINRSGGLLGRRVELIIEDNRSEPSPAVTALNKLLTGARVDLMLAGASSAATRAMSPILVRRKMPIVVASILPAEEDREGRRWIFSTAVPVQHDIQARYDYLKKLNLTRVGVIHDTTPYARMLGDNATRLAAANGMTVVGVEQYSPGTTDLSSQLTKLKALPPQAIMQLGAGPAIGLVAKNLRDIGLTVSHATDQTTNPYEAVKVAGAAAHGIVFPAAASIIYDALPAGDPRRVATRSFIEAWRAKYGKERDPNFAARGYDAFQFLVEGVKRAKSTDGTAVRDAIEGLREYRGASATYNFSPQDHNGITGSPVVMVEVGEGGSVKILP